MASLDPSTLELVVKVRDSLKVLHGQMREIERALAALPQDTAPSLFVCPQCGLDRKTQAGLEEHLANVHAIGLEEVGAPPPDVALPVALEEEPASTIGEHLAEARAVEQHQEEKHEARELARLDLILPPPSDEAA